MSETMDADRLYAARFAPGERRRKAKIWKVLCQRFFQQYVEVTDTVLDLGAGHCEFLNHIDCRVRIAVDLNPEVRQYAVAGTRVLLTASTDLGAVDESSVDVVFASNFFEHLSTKESLLQTLREVRRVLRSGGRLLVLQPNIRFVGGKYWDFFDHHLPLTDRSVVEALELIGFRVTEVRPRFLPYTTKSRLPQSPLLIRLYLTVPLVHRVVGEQAWIVGMKSD
jgi:SAM-dependent methyltransferase